MIIKANNISKKNILNDISFSAKEGDKIALIGSNGAGKTTLLNIIMSLINKDKGSIDGNKFQKAAVFQNNILDDKLTIKQNLKLRSKNKDTFNFALDLLNDLNISNLDLLYGQISGGQKRIVNFVRAMMLSPKLLILDELSAGMDYSIRKKVWEIIINFLNKNKDMGIIFTTHILDELSHANKILYLENGNVKYWGSISSFINKLPKYKLVLPKEDDNSFLKDNFISYRENYIKFFNSSQEALNYTIKRMNNIPHNLELKKTTYDDLFNIYEKGDKKNEN